MIDPLTTADEMLAAMAWLLERRHEFETGQDLGRDDIQRILSIATRALSRLPLPEPPAADEREMPAWLLALPDPQQES